MAPNTAQIDDILRKYTNGDEPGSPGLLHSVSVIVKTKTGETIYSGSSGNLTFEPDSPPFSTDSVCWLASMTKIFTSVAAMQLVERGLIGLDDDVGKFVPYLADIKVFKGLNEKGEPILTRPTSPLTLRNLATHSSGFCYDAIDPMISQYNAAVGRVSHTDSWARSGFEFPLAFEPGSAWQYGVSHDWIGQVIEGVAGCSLEEYMQKNIFQPLGMNSTTFYPIHHPELSPRRAAIGVRREGPELPLVPPSEEHPMLSIVKTPVIPPENPEWACGGVGVLSTADDVMKFLEALLSESTSILRPETVEELLRPQLTGAALESWNEFFSGPFHEMAVPEIPLGVPVNYTLGGAINLGDIPGKRKKNSVTWNGMTGGRWWIDRESGITGVLITHIMPLSDPVVPRMLDEVEKVLYASL